ncbi:MAG: ABC transporter permease [Lachnospiraceae bacterium]|nr:ABC transporter permease [Lachnospiraceae bacterium]
MQKVLRKRVFRSLKKHFVRYAMLGMMIALGIFLVVTIVGSGEMLTRGTEEMARETNLEDGEFEVFVPLTESEKDHIAGMGITLEEQFYYDQQMENEKDGTLRVFKVRGTINRLHMVDGAEPSAKDELVLEKRYAEEHDIRVGDAFSIAGVSYRVSGIAVVSDYDGPFKEVSDTSCNSGLFGLAFLTDEAYEEFSASGKTQKSEDYLYAYKLGGGRTDRDLKDYLKDLKIDASEVDDELFAEYWERTGGVEDELRDAVKDLREATDEVADAIDELSENNEDINDATGRILDSYLGVTASTIKSYGMEIELTPDNFEDELDRLADAVPDPILKASLADVKEQLCDLRDYRDGLKEYTDAVDELKDGTAEMSDGVEELDTSVDDALEEFDFELSNLTSFMKASDNPRIFATKNDKVVDIEVGIIAGVIVLILLAYVISVFVVHSIESESSIIGTLYSMGVTKNDLLLHYISLPVVVTFLSGLIGALVASTGIMAPMIAESSYQYFSIPKFSFAVPDYLWVYSLVCPPLMAVIVNVLVISSKLNRTALSLIRNEAKQGRNGKFRLGGMKFITAFRIRQMLREMRSTLAVVLGMFLSLMVFMIGVDCYVLCNNIAKDYANDTKFEYMYTLKYPEKEAPAEAEAAYAYGCKKEVLGFNFDVTILGIDSDNPFFDVKPGKSKTDVTISSAMAEKYGLKQGDEFIVTDDEKEVKYAFSVKDITRYSSGFYIFMDIDVMREMMGESKDYYNVLFSDKALDIDPGRLYSTTSRDDVVKGSEVFSTLMMPMIYTLSGSSAVIFCVVLYLMMKVMIDRSAQNISLIKVFGYRRGEIRKLYLDGNFYVIAIGALIVLPLSKKLMNMMFPFMISNVACGLNVDTPFAFYVVAFLVILALYFVINAILVRRLDKFTPAEILKNRE